MASNGNFCWEVDSHGPARKSKGRILELRLFSTTVFKLQTKWGYGVSQDQAPQSTQWQRIEPTGKHDSSSQICWFSLGVSLNKFLDTRSLPIIKLTPSISTKYQRQHGGLLHPSAPPKKNTAGALGSYMTFIQLFISSQDSGQLGALYLVGSPNEPWWFAGCSTNLQGSPWLRGTTRQGFPRNSPDRATIKMEQLILNKWIMADSGWWVMNHGHSNVASPRPRGPEHAGQDH